MTLFGTENIRFHTVKFWVQLHGLPVNRLNERTAYGVGKSLEEVSRATQARELIGGNFLRVRVGINVTRPLSRGRKVLLGNDCEVWVTFKYEKMPNFCYWCGMVSHDAKECSVWLSIKGSLPLDQPRQLFLLIHLPSHHFLPVQQYPERSSP